MNPSNRTDEAAKNCQPLGILQVENAMLQVRTVIAVTGLSETSIRRKITAGKFPRPIKDGKRWTRWRAGDVNAWLAAKAGVGV